MKAKKKIRQLAAKQLGKLAKKLTDAPTEAEAAKIKDQMVTGFYGRIIPKDQEPGRTL
jgi:hypothetical protein